MQLKILNCRVRISYPLIAALTLVLVIDTTGMCLCCLFGAVCHEAGHLVAMALQHTSAKSVQLNLFDINIRDTYKGCRGYIGEAAVLLGGPLANMVFGVVFLIIYSWYANPILQLLWYSNIILGVFNLLPIESLDGGNLLYLLLQRNYSFQTANNIVSIISFLFLLPMGTMGFLILLKSPYNFTLLFTSFYLMCIILFKRCRYSRNL
ncbi:MAG TPA: hypothetical protein GX401_00180 [Clostridiales bacterium]|nr:hypothetical protein [Clostridiales bacterium]